MEVKKFVQSSNALELQGHKKYSYVRAAVDRPWALT